MRVIVQFVIYVFAWGWELYRLQPSRDRVKLNGANRHLFTALL